MTQNGLINVFHNIMFPMVFKNIENQEFTVPDAEKVSLKMELLQNLFGGQNESYDINKKPQLINQENPKVDVLTVLGSFFFTFQEQWSR